MLNFIKENFILMVKMTDIYVIKFGGSTQKTRQDILDNVAYIQEKRKNAVVIPVVSAPYGVTDMLTKAYDSGDKSVISKLAEKYNEILGEKREFEDMLGALELFLTDLNSISRKITKPMAITSGEDHAGVIQQISLSRIGIKAEYNDGMDAGIYATKNRSINPKRTFEAGILEKIVKEAVEYPETVYIIGGYRGRFETNEGYVPVVLPNNSTDATAALVATVAKKYGNVKLEMLKDVQGIKEVNFAGIESKIAEKLSYDEAIEITNNGAEVLYPAAITIAENAGIPIRVKSRASEGTLISEKSGTSKENPFAAMSTEKRYQMTIKDPEMVIGPRSAGYLSMILSGIAKEQFNVRHTPDSAETTTFTINPREAGNDRKALEGRIKFQLEDHFKEGYDIPPFHVTSKEVYLVSIVGEGMRQPGILEKITHALKNQNVSIKSLSQPDEDAGVPSVTIGFDEQDGERAVKALYYDLFEKSRREMPEALDFPEAAV